MLKKVAIASSVVLFALIVLAGTLGSRDGDIPDKLKSRIKEAVSAERNSNEDDDLIRIYIDIHHMSHNVIRSDEKWGLKDLTLANIGILIEKAEEISDTADTAEVLEILHRWERGDFSAADKDHNFVWSKLGGTVGIATGVNEQAIPQWAKDLNAQRP